MVIFSLNGTPDQTFNKIVDYFDSDDESCGNIGEDETFEEFFIRNVNKKE